MLGKRVGIRVGIALGSFEGVRVAIGILVGEIGRLVGFFEETKFNVLAFFEIESSLNTVVNIITFKTKASISKSVLI